MVLSVIVFSLLHMAPGDLVKNLVGTRRVTDEIRRAIVEHHGLDRPVVVQYLTWLTRAVRGDFGTSVRSGAPVLDVIGDRLPLTVGLTLLAFVLAVGIGIPLGVLAARRRGTGVDRVVTTSAVVGISAPGFALGLLLLHVFAVTLRWFPTHGGGEGVADRVWHLSLPALALAVGTAAMLVRITRAAVAHELSQDYVLFARSRGLGRRRTSLMVMKNAATPVLTSAGLVLGALFGSTVLVEETFSLPGLGQLLADSITFKDVPVVQAIVLLVAAVIVGVTLTVDLLVLAVDPRQLDHRARRRPIR
ncbi:ABC transporter permease [Schaalia sp. 19OD2882]|nr:ABC transporter permease [Schaalia sp. 19OD2882]